MSLNYEPRLGFFRDGGKNSKDFVRDFLPVYSRRNWKKPSLHFKSGCKMDINYRLKVGTGVATFLERILFSNVFFMSRMA